MKIRNKITLTFLSVFFAGLMLVGTIWGFISSNVYHKQAKNSIDAISQTKALGIDTYITGQKELVSDMAAAQVFRDFLATKNNTAEYQVQLNKVLSRLDRTMLINVNAIEFWVVGPGGVILASNARDQINRNISDETSFKKATSDTFVQDISLKNGRLSYSISAPILDDKTGNLLGIVVSIMKPDGLYKIAEDRTGLGSSGESFIVNSNQLLLSPTIYKSRDTIAQDKIETQNVRDCFDEKHIDSTTGRYTDYRNVKVVGTHAKIPLTNWCVITKIDEKEVFGPSRDLEKVFILLTAIFMVVAWLSAFIISRKISLPIEKLTAGADIIANGNLTYRVATDNRDEIGNLSRSFDSMVAAILASRAEIDNKVEAQTKEIVTKSADIEDQQRAILNILEDIEADKAKQEALLLGIGDGIVATDETGKIIFSNQAATDLLQIDLQKQTGQKLIDVLIMVDDKGGVLPEDKRPSAMCLKEGKTVKIPRTAGYNYVRGDKTKMPVSVTVSPITIDNRIAGAVDVFRDVTHEKEVDRMKTEFISLSSHQLRTPLSAMKWFAEMLLHGDAGKLTTEQTDFVKNIYDSNERMIALVNSLLNISRIESDRIIIDPQPTCLGDLVSDVVKELQFKLDEKKQNLVISVHPELPNINIDPKLIREVYKNLLTNAIKYTPEGGEIQIFISKKGEEIISQVSDNGYGIPKDEHKHIFERFYRGTNIIKMETDGTGLGLYLVKAVIESSSGKLWFESEENKGSTFWFSLPLSGSKAQKGEVALDS